MSKSSSQSSRKHQATASPERRYRNVSQPGEIQAGVFYSLRALYERFGCSKVWFRKSREAGLKYCRLGRQHGVLGDTLLAWLKTREK